MGKKRLKRIAGDSYKKMKVFVIGIGLIGGSMVLDIQKMYPQATIYGIDTNEIHLQEAITLGVIDARDMIDLHTADFVIVSVPVDGALVVLPQY
jgi:prephenate dehydrogenase